VSYITGAPGKKYPFLNSYLSGMLDDLLEKEIMKLSVIK